LGPVQTGSSTEATGAPVQTGSTTAESQPAAVQTSSANIAAIVNGEIITRDTVSSAAGTAGIIQSLYYQYPRFVQALLSTTEGNAFLDAYERQILDQLIDSRLLIQQAVLAQVAVDEAALDTQVDTRIQTIEDQNQLTLDQMEQILSQQGSSLDEYKAALRASYRDQALVDALHKQITDQTAVSDAEVAAYYADHQSEFQNSDGSVKALEDVQEQIHSSLLSDAQGAAWNAWFANVKAEASIQILLK